MSKKSRKKIQPSLQSDENPTIDALWKGLTEIDFFLLMPPESSDNRVYRTETQHILQLRGEPVESFELGIYVNVGVAGGSDFLRLGAAVLKAVHPKIKEPIAWLGRALTLCEESKDDRHEEGMNGWMVTLQLIPELGYAMISCSPIAQLTLGIPTKANFSRLE